MMRTTRTPYHVLLRTLNRATLQLQKRNKTAIINVKKLVYTRVNGELHIENCKNYKKVLLLNSTLTLRRCAGV